MKRLFTRCMLVMMLIIMGITTATAQKSVLDESFASGKPAGWTAGDYWEFGNGYAQFAAPFADGADTLFTPMLDISELDNQPSVVIAYSLVANSGKVNELKVLYRASEEAAWSVWKTFNAATEGEESVKDVLPGSMTNVQIAIAGSYKLGGETRVLRLAVENKTEAADAPTGLKTEELTTNSAILWWDVCTSPKFKQYNLKVNSSKMSDMSAEADVLDRVGWDLTNEFYQLSELTPNTEYWFYVQYDCSDGDLSPWAEQSFRTPCEAISGAFAEDFEGAFSTCYTIVEGGDEAAVSGEYAYNSQKSFKSYSGKGKYNYFILPEFNGVVKNYQVSFVAAASDGGNTYARTVTVGVCTEATATSFTEVKTLNLPKGRVWESIVVSLKGYNGTGKYIAFRFGNQDKENRIFIDNVKIEQASECPKPMFVEVSEITTNSAKLKWVETGNADEWNLVLSTKPLADPEDIDPDAAKGEFAGSISANPYIANNLQPNTTYFAYLQAGCGSSEWTNAVEFKTGKEVTYPYVEHFDRMDPDAYTDDVDAIPNGWVMDTRGNNPAYANYYDKQYIVLDEVQTSYQPYVTTAQNHEATAYVRASLLLRGTGISSTDPSTSTGYTSIAMLPAMPKAVKGMMVSFWAYASASHTVKIGVANTQTDELPQGQQLGANITEVSEVAVTGGSEWKQYKVLLQNYEGTGRYITFYLKPGVSTPTVYIDDIEIDDAPNCNPITDLQATTLGVNSAKATWGDESSATSWKVKVSSTEIDPSAADGDIVNTTVNSKEYTATGLTMGATYYFYVSPACGDAWESASATTWVGVEIPYYNDFQTETQGSNKNRGPKNWTLGNINITAALGTQTNIPYVYNTAMTGAPAGVEKPSLYFYHSNSATSTGAYAIMPELLNADVKDLKISFYGSYNYATVTANYSKGMIRVGVVDAPGDINKTDKFSKVTLIKTLYCSAPKITELFSVDCSGYTGSGKYIVFYSDTAKYNYFLLDNLSITLATAPQKISNLSVSNIEETSATFTWTENGSATKWDVCVFEAAQEDPEAGTPVWSGQVTEPQAIATGMQHSKQYYAYVRSVQDNGKGDWSSVSFWTKTGIWSLPYSENFASYLATSSYRTLPQYYLLTDANDASIDGGNVYIYVNELSGEKFLKMQATSSAQYKVTTFAFPQFDKPVNTLQMTFIARSDAGSTATESAQQTAIDQSHTEIGILEADGTFVPVYSFKVKKALEWEDHYMNFQSYTGEGGRIAIRMDYNKRKATNAIRLLDFTINEMPECGRLLKVDVNDIDSMSATLSWMKSKTETKWNLKVSSTALADPEAATADVFDGQLDVQTKEISGLKGNTNYYIYIQTVDEANSCVGDWSSATVFRTLCQLQRFPYVEDFQSYEQTGAGYIPDCSTLSGDTTDHAYISSRGATGNKALQLKQVKKDYNNYFAFPALLIDSVKRLQLTMFVNPGSTTTSNYYYYEVGVMTDPNDPKTYVAVKVDSVQGAAATVFNEKKYTFESYAGDEKGNYGTFIALKPLHYKNPTSANYYAGYIYIDDVTIDLIETCKKPTGVKADSLGINGVKLTWETDDNTASHRVRIFANASAGPNGDDFVSEVVVNNDTAILEGLIGHTNYYAFVRKECADDNISNWSKVIEFTTACPEVRPIPYAEGFEGKTDLVEDYCWSSFMMQGSTTCGYLSSMSTSNPKDGERALYLSYTAPASQSGGTCGGSKNRSTAITPELDVDNLNELLVYFDAIASVSGNITGIKIEAVTDDTPEAEAVYITTVENIQSSTWKKCYVRIGDYYTSAKPCKRLRFSTTETTGAYVDNMVITKELNTMFPVVDLKLLMLSDNTIKFSFVEETPWIEQWQVAYVAAGGDIADATVKTIDKTEYTIEGLTPNTAYDIYVRGNVEGSEWVGPIAASTLKTLAPLPMITGFEDDTDLWNLYNVKTVKGAFYPNYFIMGDAAECDGTGDKALFVTNDGTSYEYYTSSVAVSAAASSVWALRNIKIDAAGTYKFSFKVKVPGNKDVNQDNWDNDYATAHLFPAGATIKAETATMLDGTTRKGGTSTDIPDKNIYSLMSPTYHQDEWIWVHKKLDIAEPGAYSVAVYWYNASVGAKKGEPVAVDSVIVEEYLCTTPNDIEFTGRAANEVSLKWFGGQCKNFDYVLSRYAKLGNPALIDEEDKIAYGTLTEGPEVTLSNLQPQTKYSFYVRTICPGEYTDWIEFDFVTPCEKYDLPYTEAFFETPECWILKSATVGKTSVGTSSDYEVWHRLSLATDGYAILPEFNVDLKNIEVEIGLFNHSTTLGAVSLGVMDNTYDMDTYQEIALFQTTYQPGSTGSYTPSQLEVFHKMLNLYQGTGKVLVLKNATTNTIGIKYITLTELPDCVKPQQVEMTFLTENAATVNWIAGVEDAWEIQLNDSIIKNVTENPYRLTNLEQGTAYTVAVRALCDEEHTSDWSTAVTFQTLCGVNPLPMFEDFSGLLKDSKAALRCWENMYSKRPIQEVIAGTSELERIPSNLSLNYTWRDNFISRLGDHAQLMSWDYKNTSSLNDYQYRWFISPQYAIEGDAMLSFDARKCNNIGNAAKKEQGRFYVAISTDNGATWKNENAYYLSDKLDSVYSVQTISLSKYAGQVIRLAFYHEGLSTGMGENSTFILIDNVRMNCSDTYPYADNACQGEAYEGHGFSIAAIDLPIAGQDSTYYRYAAAEGNGCDSTIALTITTRVAAEPTTLHETICEGDYYEFGGQKLTKPNPEGIPYQLLGETVYGCDSLVYLYLSVQQNDTATFNVTTENYELPKVVDDFYTIPADAPIGLPFDTLIKLDGCAYNRYFVTVSRCTDSVGYADQVCAGARYEGYGFVIEAAEQPAAGESKLFSHIDRTALGCDSMTTLTLTVMPVKQTMLTDNICESETTYEGYDFVIDKAEWPAAGDSKDFFKYLTSVQGCDSIVKLTLTVVANDTTDIPVTKLNTELPYTVDDLYTIPAGTEVGSFEVVLPNGNKCSYNRYLVTIEQCTQQENEADTNCEGKDYQGYGFEIPVAEQPDAGYTKDYYRDEMIEGCKVTTKLTLTVVENDTTTIPVVINADALPYIVDAIYSVPAEAQVGSFVEILPNGEDCGYNRYEVTINDVGTGLINLSDEVDHIEVFDALGRRVRTLRHGDEQYNLPAGVYMLHTVMKSGKAENRKVTLK